tara:strand:- start:2180 stop:3007 length:828 start_codon:yes stop_codon:yes gene_type:complete
MNNYANLYINPQKCACDKSLIITDDQTGDVVCTGCGLVQDERVAQYQPTFDAHDREITMETSKDQYFENKQISTMISMKSTKHNKNGFMRKLHMQTSINQKQAYRNKEFEVIERLCTNLSTTDNVSTDAKHFFLDLCKKKIYRGVNRKAMMACCILRALSMNNLVRDIHETATACEVSKSTLTKNINTYEKLMGVKILREGKCDEIYRYLQKLGVTNNQEMCQISNSVIKRQKCLIKLDEFQGKSPKIIIAIILKELSFDKKDICEALNVSITGF